MGAEGSLPREKSGQGMKITTDLHVPVVRISKAVIPVLEMPSWNA
jgi:hypothetical protein